MTTDPTSSAPSPVADSPPTPASERDSEGLFLISLGSGLLGAFLLLVAALMYITASYAELAGGGSWLIDKRQWFLAAGTGLFVLGVGLQANNIWELLYRRRSLFALNVILMSVLAIALTVLVDYVTHRHFHEFDWTRQGVFTISDESVQVAKNLDRDLRVWVIFREGGDAELVRKLVDHYRSKNPRIEVKVLDPVLDRDQLRDAIRELGLEARSFDDVEGVVVQVGTFEKNESGAGTWKTDRSKRLSKTDFFDPGFDPATGQRGRKKFKGEQAFTNALLEVTNEKKPKIYFIQGHKELEMEGRNPGDDGQCGTLVKQLRAKNYEVAPLHIMERPQKDIPEDATVVVLPGPSQAFDQVEVAALDKFIREGGRVLALLEASIKAAENQPPEFRRLGVEELFKKYGVDVTKSLVITIKRTFFSQTQFEDSPAQGAYVNQFDASSKITKPLVGSRMVLPGARVVKAIAEQPHDDPHGGPKHEKRSAVEILKTIPASIMLTDLEKRDVGSEERKSLPVAVAVEEKLEPKPGEKEKTLRLVVVGDAVFASNFALEQGPNEAFLLNAFAWLVGQERFTKEPVREGDYHLDIPAEVSFMYRLLACPGIPFLTILVGITVWIVRRR